MDEKRMSKFLFIICLFIFLIQSLSHAQRMGFTKEEFVRRRAALMDWVEDGLIVLFGECMPQPGAHFRQDNDFYYFEIRYHRSEIVNMPQSE